LNAYLHSEISVKNRGGEIEDYYPIHTFIDCTKDICSDNRHRILHTMWGINNIIVPIFGHTIINSNGKKVNVKDLCEQDHILPDYRNKFIPTLSDFVEAIDEKEIDLIDWKNKIESFHKKYAANKSIEQLLISPLSHTGKLVSLLVTHNSWFLNFILPKIFQTNVIIDDIELSPSIIFNNMNFELWMDNGSAIPQSAKKINQK
jgi:hypothetical protein